VLGQVGVGAGDQQRAPGVLGQRGPHLLPVGHPLLAVLNRAGGQRGQVAARAGLAEQLAPDLLARPERAQPALLLLLAAVGEDGRGGHAQSDRVELGVVARGARRGELGVDDVLQRAGDAQAAEPFRVMHPGQARVEPGIVEVLPGHLGRIVFGQEGADPVTDGFGGAFAIGQHRGPPAT
jgi:hypothetical protein